MSNILNWMRDNKKPITISKLCIMTLLMLFSLKVTWLAEVLLLFSIISVVTEFDFDGLYYCFFLVNFRFVFRHNLNGGLPYVTIVFFVFALTVLIKYWIVRKEKIKFNWWVIGFSLAFLAYLIFPIHPFKFSEIVKFTIMIMIINFLFIFHEKIDFKKMVWFFVLGCVAGSVIYLFVEILFADFFIPMDYKVYALGRVRYRGLTGDPNFYTLDLMLSIAGLFVLFIKKDINIVIYCIISLFLFCGAWLTYSKSMLIAMILFVIFAILTGWLREFKSNWYKPLIVIGLCLTALVITNFVMSAGTSDVISRFDVEYETNNSGESENKPSVDNGTTGDEIIVDGSQTESNENSSSSHDKEMNNILTGRWDIWKDYISEITSSPKTFLFGGGIGELVNGWESHNTVLQIVYETGFVGTCLLLGVLISMLWGLGFNKKILFPKSWINCMMPITCIILLMCISYLAATSFVYHISLAIFGLFYEKEKIIKESE